MSDMTIKRSVRVQVRGGSGKEKRRILSAARVGSRSQAERIWQNSLAKHRMKRGLELIAFMAVVVIAVTASGQEAGHSFGNPDVLQWPPSRTYHVENYKLKLRFDQLKGEVFGDETVKLRPIRPHFQKFYLNSSELTIDSVTLEQAQGTPVKLTYTSQDPRLWIVLDHDYEPTSTLNVRIVYHGFPRTGLFFVNPTPSYPNWPREVFSQGEAELNHFWFPCWDYPNDMATSETVTTVPDGQVVVSNGKLVKVTRAAGQVTYDWVESVPHSSYLISLAIRTMAQNYRQI